MLQSVVVLLPKFGDRVGGEERGVDALAGGLPRHGLGAVLAELRGLALRWIRIGPSAAGAVEPVVLIHPQQRPQAAAWPHLLQRVAHRVSDRGNTRRRCPRRPDPDLPAVT